MALHPRGEDRFNRGESQFQPPPTLNFTNPPLPQIPGGFRPSPTIGRTGNLAGRRGDVTRSGLPSFGDSPFDLASFLNAQDTRQDLGGLQGTLQNRFGVNPGPSVAPAGQTIPGNLLGETSTEGGVGDGLIENPPIFEGGEQGGLDSPIFGQSQIDAFTQNLNGQLLLALINSGLLTGTSAIEAINQLTGMGIDVNQGPPQLTSTDVAKLGANQGLI